MCGHIQICSNVQKSHICKYAAWLLVDWWEIASVKVLFLRGHLLQ